jgi:2-dehydrotetronate isomerase
MPKFAANLSMMFTEWTFLDRFQAAADAGFSAVEFLFPYEFPPDKIAARLARARLQLVLFNLPPGDWVKGERGLAALPERRDEFQKSLAQALPYIAATGVPRVHLMSGIGGTRDCYVENLRHAAEILPVDVVIEPINGRDMPGYFFKDYPLVLGILDELRIEKMKLQFDIYHRQILHGDVLTAIEQLMPRIGHIQVASVPKRQEPDSGELNDTRIFAHHDALDYPGHVGCEYRPANGTIEGLGWFRGLK